MCPLPNGAHFPLPESRREGRHPELGGLAGGHARPEHCPAGAGHPRTQRRAMPWRLGPSTAKNKARLLLPALGNRGWMYGFLLKLDFINRPLPPPTLL